MGRRGPKPKPVEQHLAEGTYRPDKHGDSPIEVADRIVSAEFLPAPSHLNDPAREVWSAVVETIVDSGILQGADELALEALALSVATWRAAQADIDDNGILVRGRFGTDVANPSIAIRDKAMAEFRAWAARFGLTPSDRASLGMTLIKGKSAAESWDDELGTDPRHGGDE